MDGDQAAGEMGPALPAFASGSAPFDEADWLRRLNALNTWANGETEGTAFEQARKAACLARWQAGRAVWNTWADAMLALKAEAEKAGVWKAIYTALGTTAENNFTGTHFSLAAVDFSHIKFSGGRVEFDEIKFPGAAQFAGATFGSKEEPCLASLTGVQFHGDASLTDVEFYGDALITGAQFYGHASLTETQFHHDVSLQAAQFHGHARLVGVRVKGEARIEAAQFHRTATLNGALFDGVARFASGLHRLK